ncbi:MAG TPA: SAM-dependent chlorinase/fluorinase [Candidatus Atribacteria bacterium]|nr:SAM-dependent chlorinase/fluorinase [Candidatus Atribacteria bacterium]
MPYIAFLTDWGYKSYYVGVTKAVIKKINPQVEIIDLTHEVEAFNVREAMYILYRAFRDFPPESVFLAVVDYGVGTERKALALQVEKGYTFVGPDNGLFTLIVENEKVVKIVELNRTQYFYHPLPSSTFQGRDIFAPCAAHLSRGIPIEELGSSVDFKDLILLPYEKPEIKNHCLHGEIAYADRFGNLQTNLPGYYFQEIEIKEGGKLTIEVGEKKFIATYHPVYAFASKGELLIHPDSSGYLEIAAYQESAQAIIKARGGEKILLHKIVS